MNIKIQIFQDNLFKTIGAGIYEIDVSCNGQTDTLYIGESICVLVKCILHLYNLKDINNYWKFKKYYFKDLNIILTFCLLKQVNMSFKRKKMHKDYIKLKEPINQSIISDRQKEIENMSEAIFCFLKNYVIKF